MLHISIFGLRLPGNVLHPACDCVAFKNFRLVYFECARFPTYTDQTGAIDDVHRSTGSASDETQRDEGKKIVEALAKLKYEMQHDRQLTYVAFKIQYRYSAHYPSDLLTMMVSLISRHIMKSSKG